VGEEAWVIFASRPIRPIPRLAGGLVRAEIAGILERAFAASVELRTRSGELVRVMHNIGGQRHNARVGLRSWIVSNAVASVDRDSLRGVYVQLGNECTVVLAVNVSTKTYLDDGPRGVHVVNAEVVDVAAGEFVALLQEISRHLYVDSPHAVLASFAARDGSGLPYECADRDDIGHFAASRSSPTPRRMQPWLTEIIPGAPLETTRTATGELSSALLNQFGVTSRLYV
jgi:hypothetical protein